MSNQDVNQKDIVASLPFWPDAKIIQLSGELVIIFNT